MGRVSGKVPREVGRQLRFVPFREFCLLNAELERASWLSWDRLALLAEQERGQPGKTPSAMGMRDTQWLTP